VVVPNAASDAWSSPISAELLVALKQKYRLTDNYCIAVGTMQPRKNIIRLIEAFLSCKTSLPDAKLVLVGNPLGYHVDPAIRTMALAPPPNICFTGYVNDDELRALVAGSRALFVPSLYEGFGIPILEGFESGVPVGVSDIPPFREVAGEAALFFDPLSLESMQKALYTLFIDRGAADELVKKGLVQKKRYSWRRSASTLLQYYNHC
jgi:glycosyltransferase involved in cell wall biosynthesis